MARFRVTAVDSSPPDLPSQVPFEFELLRQIAGPDRDDYWLAQLVRPLTWASSSRNREIHFITVASRYEGAHVTPEVRRITVGLAYVIDDSLLGDASLTFTKVEYAAIASAERVAT